MAGCATAEQCSTSMCMLSQTMDGMTGESKSSRAAIGFKRTTNIKFQILKLSVINGPSLPKKERCQFFFLREREKTSSFLEMSHTPYVYHQDGFGSTFGERGLIGEGVC